MTRTIRKAQPEEASELTEIAFLSKAYWGYSREFLNAWRAELEVTPKMIKNSISFVIEENDKVVGFCCVSVQEELSYGRLFIVPEAIKNGMGKALCEAIIIEAKKLNLRFLTWRADPNTSGFYLKMGAEHVGDIESEFLPGIKLPIFRYYL